MHATISPKELRITNLHKNCIAQKIELKEKETSASARDANSAKSKVIKEIENSLQKNKTLTDYANNTKLLRDENLWAKVKNLRRNSKLGT